MTRSVNRCVDLLSHQKRRNTIAWLLSVATLLASLSPIVSQTRRKPGSRGVTQDPNAWKMQSQKTATLTAPDTQFKMSGIDQTAWIASVRQSQGAAPTRRPSTMKYEVFNAEFRSEDTQRRFSVSGATVFNRFDRFADFFIKADEQAETVLRNVNSADGLVWFEWAGTAEAPPPLPIRRGPRARGEAEKIVRGGLDGLTGKGVTIAIVDSGVDFRNPDFIEHDAQGRPSSRLLYLWDTTSNAYETRRLGGKAPVTYPNGRSVGTLYSRADLDKELRSPIKRIPATDLNGHGTACAGVAAGNGNNGKGREEVKGVAPEANIIAVRIGRSEEGSMENSFLLGAIAAWLDSVSGKTPLIMSCSFGGQYGGHDGNLIEERQLNARFTADRVGRALAIAAGNEAILPIHTRVKFRGQDAPGLMKFMGGLGGGQIQIFYDSGDLNDLAIAPAGTTQFIGNPSGSVNPLSQQANGAVRVGAGVGGLYLFNHSGREMTADAYIYPRLADDEVRFTKESVIYEDLVGTPGTTPNAITVASYDWNSQFRRVGGVVTVNGFCSREAVPIDIGNISCYSSPGYARNGNIKPEIAAPGEIYHASYAKLPTGKGVNPEEWEGAVDFSGNYCLFNGTSAATPYLAGIVALMFQKNPNLNFGEVKKLLEENATQNAVTMAVPNQHWGYGKLDIDAVKRVLGAIT